MNNDVSNQPAVQFAITWEKGKVSEITTNSRQVDHFLGLMKMSRAYNTWVSYAQDLKVFFKVIMKTAVSLLNYGMRESALQKLMGHSTLNMTLEYARILDQTVEQAFNKAVTQMQLGPLSWVPSFFSAKDYTVFNEVEALNWIRLPFGYCRRNPKLHCESDVKCLLCESFQSSLTDLSRLQEMHQQYLKLEMPLKAKRK